MNKGQAGYLDNVTVFLAWVVMSWPWLIGASFTTGDNIGFYFPMTNFVVTSLLHGDPPWWNPLAYGGQPLLGDPQSMVFSPHNVIGLLCGRAFNLHIFDLTTLSCLLLGGLATRAIGSHYSDQRALPLLGAIVFMMGGVAASRLQHVSQIISYCFIPIQLLVIRRICLKPDWTTAAFLALVMLPSLFSPNQVAFLSIITLAPFLVLFLAQSTQRRKAITIGAVTALVVLLIATPILACFREFLSISNRPDLLITASNVFSFPMFNFAGFILPGLYGVMKVSHGLWPPTDCSEDYIYIGLIPALIFIIILLRPMRASSPSLLAALLTVVWCIFSLGNNSPLYPFLFGHVPGMSGFRRPADAAFLFNASISLAIATATIRGQLRTPKWIEIAVSATIIILLVVVGYAAVRQLFTFAEARHHTSDLAWSYKQLGLRVLILVGAIVLARAVPKPRRRAAITVLAISLSVFDMAQAGRFSPIFVLPYTQSAEAELYRSPKNLIGEKPGPADVLRYLDEHEADSRRQERIETLGGGLAANLPMAAGLSMTQGYNPLTLASYSSVVGTQNLQAEGKRFTLLAPDYNSEIYRRLSLRYVLIPTYTLSLPTSPGGVANIRIRAAMVAGHTAKLIATINEYEVWELASWLPKSTLSSHNPSVDDECHVLKYRNDFIRIQCSTKAPENVIIGDNFAPGWSACVNDKPVAISNYMGIFRQVPIVAGRSIITMLYEPIPFLRFKRCR